MGKLNFPSVRSSAKPLFSVYCDREVLAGVNDTLIPRTCLCALQIHVVVSYLEVHAELVDERYIVPRRQLEPLVLGCLG